MQSVRVTITFMGTGTSQGVPFIGCDCHVCRSTDPRDKRYRCSLWVRNEDVSFVVDTPPEFRLQVLREGIKQIDAAVFTHPHVDHIMGFDDLRRFCEMTKRRLPIYGSQATLDHLKMVFPYAFDETNTVSTYLHAEPHAVSERFDLKTISLEPVELPHGSSFSYGYLIYEHGVLKCAYLNDCVAVPEPLQHRIMGVPLLVLDTLREAPHPTHMNFTAALEVYHNVKPELALGIHLTHDKTHAEWEKDLPDGFRLSYDGMTLER